MDSSVTRQPVGYPRPPSHTATSDGCYVIPGDFDSVIEDVIRTESSVDLYYQNCTQMMHIDCKLLHQLGKDKVCKVILLKNAASGGNKFLIPECMGDGSLLPKRTTTVKRQFDMIGRDIS